MDTPSTNVRELQIDGMSGDACVKKVTEALKPINGVTTQAVKVGSATINANDQGCKAACGAIGAAGYKAHENAGQSGKHEAPGAHDSKTADKSRAGSLGSGGSEAHGTGHKVGEKDHSTGPRVAEKQTESGMPGNPDLTPEVIPSKTGAGKPAVATH